LGFTALVQAVLAALAAISAPAQAPLLSPREQAQLVVVSSAPGISGVFLGDVPASGVALPRGRLVFADQEGGLVKAFPDLPPAQPASAYTTAGEAFAAGKETGAALQRAGVDVDLAPVLDSSDGPLGSRQFRRQTFGVAFLRGLLAAGAASCVKHFPGLGTAPVSTDEDPHVHARVRRSELAGFRWAIRAGAPCVMVNHAFYKPFGRRRASLETGTYRLLRHLGFRGVAMTDSLDVAGSSHAVPWAKRAIRAGADLLLVTNPSDARRVVDALVPLARQGLLDDAVARVLELRHAKGLPRP